MGGRVLRRLRRTLKHLGVRRRLLSERAQPADAAWREMMAEADSRDAERRLAAAESALNRLR